MTNKPTKTKSNQSKEFIRTARELGCDEDGESFEKAFAKAVPPKRPKTPEPSFISDLKDIPTGEKYVLVMPGRDNGDSRHSRGITMYVAKDTSDDLAEFEWSDAIERARSIAKKEGIDNVYVLK